MLGDKAWLNVSFQFIPKLWDGLRSGLSAGQKSSSTPNSHISLCLLVNAQGHRHVKTRKGPSPNGRHNTGSTQSKISLYAVALGVPFNCNQAAKRQGCPHAGHIVYTSNVTSSVQGGEHLIARLYFSRNSMFKISFDRSKCCIMV